jgi:hypothetical protein
MIAPEADCQKREETAEQLLVDLLAYVHGTVAEEIRKGSLSACAFSAWAKIKQEREDAKELHENSDRYCLLRARAKHNMYGRITFPEVHIPFYSCTQAYAKRNAIDAAIDEEIKAKDD